MTAFDVGGVKISQNGPLFLIAGPCVIEDRPGHTQELAARIAEICADCDMPLIFKASFDKANRTNVDSYRGPGLDKGCEILAEIKSTLKLPVLTDVHEPEQAARITAYGIDILQIPAYLCRQTDLLVAAGETGVPVNVKKGQFVDPLALSAAIEKVRGTGNTKVMATERGTFFGYNHLVNDMRAIRILSDLGVPVIFDGTHSVQRPASGADGRTAGDRRFVPLLTRAAVASGCHGLFLEVHEQPEIAPCDKDNMLPADQLGSLLQEVKRIHAALDPQPVK